MGIGDEVMALGRAQAIARRTGSSVAIVDAQGRLRHHSLWENAPGIDAAASYRLCDCPGHRPYIARYDRNRNRFIWRAWQPSPATIALTEAEDAIGRQYAGRLVFEDRLKPGAPPNKRWPHWGQVLLPPDALRVSELGLTIREAAAVLKHCRAYVGHEGALHHLAAAFGQPAVVIMGGYVGPAQTGYALANHRYLTGGAQPCGHRSLCEHCSLAMRAITPQAVVAALEEVTT